MTKNVIQRYGVVSVAILLLIPFYLAGQKASLPQQRTTPSETQWPKTPANQAGSAMRPGTETLLVLSDGKSADLYSMIFKIPANTVIPPHSHPDNRSCFVLSGLWYFGYGSVRSEAGLKALPPGSHYTEPAGTAHFAGTQGQEAVLECTAVGPAGTTFVNPANVPKN